jgi:hypothetical protein
MGRLASLGLVLLFIFAAAPQPRARASEIDALYKQAKAALAAKRYQQALALCEDGLARDEVPLERRWSFLVGAALAHDGLEATIAALSYYHAVLASLAANEARLPEAWRKRRAGLEERVKWMEERVLAKLGAVTIASTPPGARVAVDGQTHALPGADVTPVRLYLKAGRHAVRLLQEGFEPADIEVHAREGQREKVHVPLYQRTSKGRLFVRTGSADAEVLVDGQRLGAGIELRTELLPGEHLVQVNRPDKAPFQERVRVVSGEQRSVVARWSEAPVKPREARVAPKAKEEPRGAEISVKERSPSKGAGLDPIWGWVTAGTGLAIALAGIPFTVMAAKDHDDLDAYQYMEKTGENDKAYADLKSGMETKQTVGGVLYGLGGVTVAAGAGLLLFGTDWNGPSAQALGITPLDGGGYVSWSWRW